MPRVKTLTNVVKMSEMILVAIKIPRNTTPNPMSFKNNRVPPVPSLFSAKSICPVHEKMASVFQTIKKPTIITAIPSKMRNESDISENSITKKDLIVLVVGVEGLEPPTLSV